MSRGRSRRIRINKDDADFAEHGWFSCPNKLVRDSTLSPAARWAYSYMVANQTGWHITAEDIAESGNMGIHAAEDLVYELEVAGYVTRHYTREQGRITGIEYKLKAVPVPEAERTNKPRKERVKRSSFPKKAS